MTSQAQSGTALLVLASSIIITGCSSKPTEPATETPPAAVATPAAATAPAIATPPAAGTAPAPAPVAASLGTAQYNADPALICELLEVKRVSGGALLVRWRVINTAGSQPTGSLAATPAKDIYYDFEWNDIYFIDPAENKKYGYLTDAEGKMILDVFYGTLKPGEQRLNWAKFPAPPATSTRISLSLGKFLPFEDVPISG